MKRCYSLSFLFILFVIVSCAPTPQRTQSTFELVSSEHSGIDFNNSLVYDHRLNAYTFRNFYNGAGVALGDINNDGLLDIYFSGNLVENKLYLNKGNFKFEDITSKAGVSCSNTWSTGVSMADVNGDGWLDIFVCKSGPPLGGIRHNQLFINNGDLTFTDKSKEWGVADEGLSLHAAFLDYDHDGDQDFYLLNNSNRSVGVFDLRKGQRDVSDPFGGNKFYRNDGNRFTDVSKQVGIFTSAIGFGLGVSVADVNKDGWQDIFVSNDFFERDYLYINLQNGTFRESLTAAISETSMGSMGADIADINNDALPDIFVTDMLPERLDRIKTKISFESYDKYAENIRNGYHRQFNRNTLQLNMGAIPADSLQVFFHEIGRYAGVSSTDWSWGALIFDYDNDGYKDIFIANGIAKDLLDQDYVNFYAPSVMQSSNFGKDSTSILALLDRMPSEPLENYLFKNEGNLQFTNVAKKSGLNIPSFSNGAVYGDLNNDGALDLVISNINQPAFIYKNLNLTKRSFIQFDLRDEANGTTLTGSQVTVHVGSNRFYSESSSGRGYLSSTDPRIHIGLGNAKKIDSIEIKWPDGLCSYLYKQRADTTLSIIKNAKSCKPCNSAKHNNPIFEKSESGFDREIVRQSGFIDFNRDRLLTEAYSNRGTAFAKGDLNNDGYEDLFIGGAAGLPGKLLLFDPAMNRYSAQKMNESLFLADASSEDSDAVFFDYNKDGMLDLFVASGSNIYSEGSFQLNNRLYLNQGDGRLLKEEKFIMGGAEKLPTYFVKKLDLNQDGLTDLLLGHSFSPFKFGHSGSIEILINTGNGFANATTQYGPFLNSMGMVTDLAVVDYDRDGDNDLISCGYWMGLRLIENRDGVFQRDTPLSGAENISGLFNKIELGDFNSDGFIDIVAGNAGLNNLYRSSESNPWSLYVGDVDQNMNEEQIICITEGGKEYPVSQYLELSKQIPMVRKRASDFASYKNMSMTDLFDTRLSNLSRLTVNELGSAVFLNEAGKHFKKIMLPVEAQFSKVYSICVLDFNQDNKLDLILGGNEFIAKPEWGAQTASHSIVLNGNGDGTFTNVPTYISTLYVEGEVRRILEVRRGENNSLIFMVNNEQLKSFKVK